MEQSLAQRAITEGGPRVWAARRGLALTAAEAGLPWSSQDHSPSVSTTLRDVPSVPPHRGLLDCTAQALPPRLQLSDHRPLETATPWHFLHHCWV